MRGRERLGWHRRVAGRRLRASIGAVADVLLEAIPLRFFRVLVFLAWVFVFTPRTPVAAAAVSLGPCAFFTYRCVSLAFRTRPFPAALAFATASITGRIARFEQLSAFEPLHHRGRVFLL